MANWNVHIINNIVKEYNDMIKVIIYKNPQPFVVSDVVRKRNRREVNSEDYSPTISSLQRTKNTVQDIVLCNDFELFCTFTFDRRRVNRYSYYACCSTMRRWLQHQREISLERGVALKYLVIPEAHKDGAWHFHALISGYTGKLKATGKYTPKMRPIYNIPSYRSGFTTAVEIDSKEGVSSYITKYITKSFVQQFNKRRFFCSHNLDRPRKSFNNDILSNVLPIFRNKVYESENQILYHIDKKNMFDINDIDNVNVAQYTKQDF